MPASPRVTVVIPAYNVGRFIDETLASVAAQTHPAHEVVVVDDGSSDDTNLRIRAWGGQCGASPLILLDGPNRGLSASRNRAMMAGSGELFAFLDGDDCFLPWHLERLISAFEAIPGLAVAFGDSIRFREGGEDLLGNLEPIRLALRDISTPIPHTELLRLGPELRCLYVEQTAILPSSWLVSRVAVVLAGMFDPSHSYAEDIDFLWRILGVGDAVWYDGATSRRREHGENASDPRRAEWSEPQILRALGRLRNFTPGLTEAEAQALDRQLRSTLWVTGWLAAGHGLTHYRAWRRDARRWTGRRAPLRLKQLLRALRRSAPLGGVPSEPAIRPQRSPVPES